MAIDDSEDGEEYIRQFELMHLRAKLQLGLDQLDRGESVLFTSELMDKLRQEAETRLRNSDHPSADVMP